MAEKNEAMNANFLENIIDGDEVLEAADEVSEAVAEAVAGA